MNGSVIAGGQALAQQLEDQKRINAALQNEVHWLYAIFVSWSSSPPGA